MLLGCIHLCLCEIHWWCPSYKTFEIKKRKLKIQISTVCEIPFSLSDRIECPINFSYYMLNYFCYHKWAPESSLCVCVSVCVCVRSVGLFQIWLLLTFLCSFLIFSIWHIAVWPFAKYFIDCSFVTGYGSLSEPDWRGLERLCVCLKSVWFGEGPNYMTVLPWNLLVAGLFCSVIPLFFEDFAQCKMT